MSEISAWRYYKHAMVPNVAPHETVDLSELESGELWWKNPKALLSRWTTDFDCGYETNWWYLIKDEPFDIDSIKAKRRYDIKRGKKFFEVVRIIPEEYIDEIYTTQVAAFEEWSAKYRPVVNKRAVMNSCVQDWAKDNIWMYAAFFRPTRQFAGYAYLTDKGEYVNFNVLRVRPEYEKYQINAALIDYILEDWKESLTQGYYICDGERNILHETAFQQYLERYFGFRKAHCNLHIRYRPGVSWIIRCLYPFRNLLKRLDSIAIINKINGVLRMESVVKGQEITDV